MLEWGLCRHARAGASTELNNGRELPAYAQSLHMDNATHGGISSLAHRYRLDAGVFTNLKLGLKKLRSHLRATRRRLASKKRAKPLTPHGAPSSLNLDQS